MPTSDHASSVSKARAPAERQRAWPSRDAAREERARRMAVVRAALARVRAPHARMIRNPHG
jgi:hypothetical protein